MAITPEAITLLLLLRTIWLITMPKALFVPYDKRGGIATGPGLYTAGAHHEEAGIQLREK